MMALLFTIILGGAAAILGYSGYFMNKNYFILNIEKILDTEYRYLSEANERGQLEDVLEKQLLVSGRIYFLGDKNNQMIIGNFESLPQTMSALGHDIFYFSPNGQSEVYAAKIYKIGNERTLLVGENMSDLLYTEKIILMMGGATIILMMLVILVSYLISHFVVSRTNRIAETAQTIMQTGDLSRRITIDSRWDDLGHMAYVLNTFLSRIEELMFGIKKVADNIAHDLRTPLTRLRHNLENIQSDKKYDEDKFEGVIREADHILSTFQAVLRISKIENAPATSHFKLCDLGKIVNDVIELYEPLASEKSIIITKMVLPTAPFEGDSDLLFQMMANILDNAIKFTPNSGEIIVSLRVTDEGRYQIECQDSGGGIQHNDINFVFDRFYRGEKSRHTDGNGLGLSMVKAIVNLHKGIVFLRNTEKGLKVSVILVKITNL